MPERILLVQFADIGDLILTTPAIRALREALPDAHLALLTSSHSAPVIGNMALVDEMITFDRTQFNFSKALLTLDNLRQIGSLRKGRYDTVIYFHHFTLKLGTPKFALIGLVTGAKRRIGLQNGNGWFLTESILDEGFGAKHQAQYWLDLVGLLGADTQPQPAQMTTAAITGIDIPEKSGVRVVIHPGSGGYSLARRWSPESFAQVADTLHNEHNAQIILIGTPDDDTAAVKAAMQHEPLDLTGKTSLGQIATLLKDTDLYIGADSGVMHIAATIGTPLVAIFGPSNHEAYGPWTPHSPSIVIRSAPECSPCSYVGHGIGLRHGCAARTCMRMVTPEQVIDAANAVLNGDVGTYRDTPTSTIHRSANNRIRILGLPVDAVTYEQWLDQIDQWVKTGERLHHICTTNPEFMMIARKDPNFHNILMRADMCIPDGVGLLWAAKRQGTPMPERVTGSDGTWKIAERAAKAGWKLFLLGAAEGVAARAATILQEKYPGLTFVGTFSGSRKPEAEDAIVEMVNASGADILLVAFGAPVQDKWIARNSPRLNVKMAMGVGGAFDFIAGVVPRAPMWMRNAGLEWLFRLIRQPRRFKRMLRLPLFVWAVLRDRRELE